MADTKSTDSVMAVESARPRRKTGFIWRKMGGEAVLFNPATNETYMLNPTAAVVWELCNGEHSIDNIIETIAEKFEAEKAEILKDIVEFIEMGQRDGYILTSE